MNAKELIEFLLTVPPDTFVYKSDLSGCHECNEDGIDYYNEVNWPRLEKDAPVDGYGRPFRTAVIL